MRCERFLRNAYLPSLPDLTVVATYLARRLELLRSSSMDDVTGIMGFDEGLSHLDGDGGIYPPFSSGNFCGSHGPDVHRPRLDFIWNRLSAWRVTRRCFDNFGGERILRFIDSETFHLSENMAGFHLYPRILFGIIHRTRPRQNGMASLYGPI